MGWFNPVQNEKRVMGQTVSRGPLDQEKLRAGVTTPAYMPFWNKLQDLEESPKMRAHYRKMLANPIIKSCTFGKILGIASLELKIHPASEDPRDEEIAEFVRWNLVRRIRGGFSKLVWNILSGALVDGFSVNEKVWGEQKWGKYKGKQVLRALKMKDVDCDLALWFDEFKNIISVMGLRWNFGQELDPRDFVIYQHKGLYEVPGGMSDFRAVYGAAVMFDMLNTLRGAGASKIAHGFIIGEYANDTYETSLTNALAKVKSGHYAAVPPGTNIQMLDLAGSSSEWWSKWFKDLSDMIVIGLEGAPSPTLPSEPGVKHGNTEVQKTKTELFKWDLATAVEQQLNELDDDVVGIIKDLVDQNYEGVDDYPTATLGSKSAEELAADLRVDQGLHGMGFDHNADNLAKHYNREQAETPNDMLPGRQREIENAEKEAAAGAKAGKE